MTKPLTHRELVGDYIELSLDNAIDDMGDDGVSDAWISQIAQNSKTLRNLLELRHSLECPRGEELPGCASCGDDMDEMHFACCDLPENDAKCREMLDDLIYGDFIRPRPI